MNAGLLGRQEGGPDPGPIGTEHECRRDRSTIADPARPEQREITDRVPDLRKKRHRADWRVVSTAVVSLSYDDVDAGLCDLPRMIGLPDDRHDPGAVGVKLIHVGTRIP